MFRNGYDVTALWRLRGCSNGFWLTYAIPGIMNITLHCRALVTEVQEITDDENKGASSTNHGDESMLDNVILRKVLSHSHEKCAFPLAYP